MSTLDLRAGELNVHGNAGASKVIVTTWTDSDGDAFDLTGSTVSLWLGGTVTDPTDLTDATEVAGVISTNTATFTLTIPDTRQPLRMTLDGALVSIGRVILSSRGAASPTDEVTVHTAAASVAITLDGAAAIGSLTDRLTTLEAVDPLTQAEGDARYYQLTTDLASQAELDTEATTRANADTALDGRVDTIEADYLQAADITGKQDLSEKGAVDGYAELDGTGKVPSAQLPSFVDDVIEAADFAALPATGEAGKIYVTLDDNKTYRWSGSAYAEISASLALGETSTTAYRGDRGKTAYDHSQLTSGNPHSVTKGDVGLGSVDNTSDASKPVSTAQQTALDLKAPLASPTLTGVPAAPTAAQGTSTTQLATTAFVQTEAGLLIPKSLMTTDGDLLTRTGGVPARMTRAQLAADPAPARRQPDHQHAGAHHDGHHGLPGRRQGQRAAVRGHGAGQFPAPARRHHGRRDGPRAPGHRR